MKRSEIKDLYNQSDSALRLLKCMALILPYCNGEQATAEATQKAAAQAAALWNPVKVMCDYMIDDGSIDMTERLQNIKAEVSQIELSVAKMGYSKEQMPLLLNCRAIINQIKDMEAWTANNPQPQQKHTEAPQQPIGGNSGELAGNGNETQPQGKEQPVINKEDLPTIYDDEVNKDREQQVLYNAIQRGWMELKGTTYNWLKNYDHLAFMCGLLYWGDKVIDDRGTKTDSVGEYPKILSKSSHRFKYNQNGSKKSSKDIMELFGGVDVSNYRSQLKELPEEYGSIMRLFPTE